MSKKKKTYSPEHWRNIIKWQKHRKNSRLDRERISEQIHALDSSLDLTGLKNGELHSILYHLKRED